jgi:7,8-dihydropterin-6-yl-methyl-4-(beta-D-ribofuranosyl)aminobenzene 5'-phosphate synthase
MKVANVDKLHAVVGGLHLGMAPRKYLARIVDQLEKPAADVILPMPCAGPAH